VRRATDPLWHDWRRAGRFHRRRAPDSSRYRRKLAAGCRRAIFDTFHANIEEKDVLAGLGDVHAVGALGHVHISENDRGTPGRGHARIAETIVELKRLGYDGWLTIEAFGRAVPELAAATRVWRDFFASPEEVYTEGYALIRDTWDQGVSA